MNSVERPLLNATIHDLDTATWPDPYDTEGSKWADAKFEEGLTGTILASPYRKKGSKGVWDWEANGNNQVFADVLTEKITIQDALDIAQRNWEESYELPT